MGYADAVSFGQPVGTCSILCGPRCVPNTRFISLSGSAGALSRKSCRVLPYMAILTPTPCTMEEESVAIASMKVLFLPLFFIPYTLAR